MKTLLKYRDYIGAVYKGGMGLMCDTKRFTGAEKQRVSSKIFF